MSADGDKQAGIPVIDFAKCGLEVKKNCGFAYLKHTGITLKDIAKVNSVADEFFEAPLELKNKYASSASKGYTGYVGIGAENVDPSKPQDHKEGFIAAAYSLKNL